VRLRAQTVVALDSTGVAGAVVGGGMGAPRVQAFSQVPLTPGALEPSPFEANLRRPDEVREALGTLVRALGGVRGAVTLVLPNGVARVLLLEAPGDVPARQFARYRLAPGLMYPPDEAIIDVLPLTGGRVLAAAVRRSVVEGYEAAAQAAGLDHERLDLAPLAAAAALLREAADTTPTVHVVLGDAAASLAAMRGGVLHAFRTRLRDASAGEAARLEEDADRTAALAGAGPAPRLRVVGPGAAAMARAWTDAGRAAEAGWRGDGVPREVAEMVWLGGALA
jgi:hypothetical protein